MNELNYFCPHCGESNGVLADPSGGSNQVFTTDCEICCRPIRITLILDADGEPLLDAVAE